MTWCWIKVVEPKCRRNVRPSIFHLFSIHTGIALLFVIMKYCCLWLNFGCLNVTTNAYGEYTLYKTAKVLCKHQYKDITDLTFVCLNYFSKVCGEFSVAGIDSLIWFCLLKVISFIPMHKYGPLNVSLALWYLKLQQTFPLRHSRDEHWFCCLLCLTF